MSSRYLDMVRGQRRTSAGFQLTAKSLLTLLACVAMIGSAVYWWGVQSELTSSRMVAAAFTAILVLAPPALVSFLIPWSPGGMLLQKINARTWGYMVVVTCALFLVFYSFQIQWSWWAAQAVVADSNLVYQQVFIGIIGFIVIPALLWTPVTSEELVEQVRQAHLVKRYELQTQADIAILRATLLRAQEKALVGFAKLTLDEREELAGVMRGLVSGIDRSCKKLAQVSKRSAARQFPSTRSTITTIFGMSSITSATAWFTRRSTARMQLYQRRAQPIPLSLWNQANHVLTDTRYPSSDLRPQKPLRLVGQQPGVVRSGCQISSGKVRVNAPTRARSCERAYKEMMMFAHGLNIGHGFTKYVIIDAQGQVRTPLVFPSQVAAAEGASAGAIVTAQTVTIGGAAWWTGEDAGRLGSPIVKLGHDRLTDPVYIPALALAAHDRMGLNGQGAGGYCVTGLPGSWAEDQDMCRTLYDQVKKALPGYFGKVLVIAEQEALAYCKMLDNHGVVVGDSRYAEGRGLSIDLGHHTDDAGKLDRARRVKGTFNTYRTGTARALGQCKNFLMARFDRDFSLHDADMAVRRRAVMLGGGRSAALPSGWDRYFIDNAGELVNSLQLDYGNGGDLDYVLLGGGGALNEFKVDAVTKAYPFTEVVSDPDIGDDPQLAIALGYARVARLRMAQQGLLPPAA